MKVSNKKVPRYKGWKVAHNEYFSCFPFDIKFTYVFLREDALLRDDNLRVPPSTILYPRTIFSININVRSLS